MASVDNTNYSRQSNPTVIGPKSYNDTWAMNQGLQEHYERSYASIRGGTSGQNTQYNDFVQFEQAQFNIISRQNKDMLVNLIRYDNVPPSLNTAQLEIMLRSMGGIVCVGRERFTGDIVILDRNDEIGVNIYGGLLPGFFDSNSALANKKVITDRNLEGDFVVFYNKQSLMDFSSSDFAIVDHYSSMLATIKATERMNLLQFRLPYIIQGPKNSMTGATFADKLARGEMFWEIDDGVEFDKVFKKLDLRVDDKTPTLQNAYRNTMNEMLTLFGVYNNPDQKAERKITAEQQSNNHIIEGMGDIYLNARRHSVELLNKAFGTEITVGWNSPVATMFRNMSNPKNLQM